ncbi:oxidoreductase-like domain-containing protein [Paraburkholderia sartisoli]|uniref:oxidoreductase-like domain-containing protein n=1 Tax=Paraburkholderia sartisoli TaxID=83784 RepID=UPI0038990E1A
MPQASNGDDPMPVPPTQPELEDCCGSGCDPCIFDIYEAALERYRVALAAWEARHRAKRTPRAGTARVAREKKPRRTRS